MNTVTKKAPAAQVEFAKKAAAVAAAKPQAQHGYKKSFAARKARRPRRRAVNLAHVDDDGDDGDVDADSQPLRLISKAELLERIGVTFPTIWQWMRDGKFPRSRELGGKACWIESEVEAWINALPKRRYKGDRASAA